MGTPLDGQSLCLSSTVDVLKAAGGGDRGVQIIHHNVQGLSSKLCHSVKLVNVFTLVLDHQLFCVVLKFGLDKTVNQLPFLDLICFCHLLYHAQTLMEINYLSHVCLFLLHSHLPEMVSVKESVKLFHLF